jgi:hypothetical protein
MVAANGIAYKWRFIVVSPRSRILEFESGGAACHFHSGRYYTSDAKPSAMDEISQAIENRIPIACMKQGNSGRRSSSSGIRYSH